MVVIYNITVENFGEILSFLDLKNHMRIKRVNKNFKRISDIFLPNIEYDDDNWIKYLKGKEIKDPIIINKKNIFNWFMITMKYGHTKTSATIYNKYKKQFNPFANRNVALYVAKRDNHTNLVNLLTKNVQ